MAYAVSYIPWIAEQQRQGIRQFGCSFHRIVPSPDRVYLSYRYVNSSPSWLEILPPASSSPLIADLTNLEDAIKRGKVSDSK
jgi:hypothetical protein